MTFSRVSGNPNEVLPNALLTDRALDDQGYLWWRSTTSWSIERRITTPPGKLLDVQAEPTLNQGSDDDVAVSPTRHLLA